MLLPDGTEAGVDYADEAAVIASVYRPLDFLSKDEQSHVRTLTVMLRKVAVEKPADLELELEDGLDWIFKKIPTAYVYPQKVVEWYSCFSGKIRKYGTLCRLISEIINDDNPGVAISYGWAGWPDGTIYEIRPPIVKVITAELTIAQIISLKDGVNYVPFTAGVRDKPNIIPWKSAQALADYAVPNHNIIVISNQEMDPDRLQQQFGSSGYVQATLETLVSLRDRDNYDDCIRRIQEAIQTNHQLTFSRSCLVPISTH